MLKIASCILGLLFVVVVTPISQATTFQLPIQLRIPRQLYAQKLVPIKKSFTIKDTVVKQKPVVKKYTREELNLSTDSKDKAECEQITKYRSNFGVNDRPVVTANTLYNNSNSVNNQSCTIFRGKF
jgi:hypothetical protein